MMSRLLHALAGKRMIYCAGNLFQTKMEVTKSNFLSAFNILQSSIAKADFIAIDGEFTGLSTLKGRRITYDTVEERYEKFKKGSSEFMLIQYGVCLFTWNKEIEAYEAMPFTFYIFPRPYKRFYNDVMFMCQSSSIDFLTNNGFDFNKLFYEGISFMTPWEEKKAQVRLNKELSFVANKHVKSGLLKEKVDSSKKATTFIPKDQREYIENICNQVESFVNNVDVLSLDLPIGSPFQRKLTYEKLEEKYPLGLYLESAVNAEKQKFIRVLKVTVKDSEQKKEEKYQSEMEELDEIVGFTKVIKLISESKKLIVGHNMFYDLFFTTTHFFSHPPASLYDYKLLLSSIFPTIIDTKLMATTQPLMQKCSGTSLKNLMDSIEDGSFPTPNVVDSKELEDRTKGDKQFHQAGYDAYCTGYVFLSLSKCLFESLDAESKHIDITSNSLSPFVNRVNILGIRDVKYMNITGKDEIPSREHVFRVNFPHGWSEKNLEDLFSPVCSLSRPTVWINDTSVYVTLADKEKSNEVLRALVECRKHTDSYEVVPYNWCVDACSEILPEKPVVKKRKKEEVGMEDGEIASDDEDGDAKNKKTKMFKESKDW